MSAAQQGHRVLYLIAYKCYLLDRNFYLLNWGVLFAAFCPHIICSQARQKALLLRYPPFVSLQAVSAYTLLCQCEMPHEWLHTCCYICCHVAQSKLRSRCKAHLLHLEKVSRCPISHPSRIRGFYIASQKLSADESCSEFLPGALRDARQ